MALKKYISLSNLTNFLNNLKSVFATKTEVNAKSDKSHTHLTSDITNLQSVLDEKAPVSHGTHVTFSSTKPVMDGTASVGSASTVARSDHKHPTDTSRAAQTDLDTHTGNSTIHITSAERTNWGTGYTHSQSAHAPSNAEKNQNAFSYIKVGDTSIAADSATDTITLVAGSNVTITPDATNDKITIDAKDTTYTLGSFGVTATAAELNKLDGVTATATEINYVDGVTSNIQTQLDNKAAKSHTHTVANISDLTATAKELNYMDGVTSNVQTQLDGKASSGHTHNYAGSSSVGGAATSANKLNTNDGSATQPVYFSNGVPVATTYTLGKSVPSNAVFTDTHYASKNVVGATNATSNTATALTNGNVYINSVENGAVTSSHKISGAGATTVTTDTNGDIVITSTDNNTTYSAAGSALGLVKTGGDVSISNGVITVNDDSHNHTIANIDNLQSSLDAKQATITGGASTITSSNLTASRALVSDGSGKVSVSAVTSTELGYLDGVTSNVQTQLDGKASSSHTHNYAGSSSAGGAATSANKLNTDAGSVTHPVYFKDGIPVPTTYTLGKSVPSDAKFTDTTYSAATTSANGLMSSTDKKRVESLSGTYSLGSFASKTVADLQTALDTWLNSYVNIANSSAKFQASHDWVTAWNSGNTATTISAGGTWTVTNIAPYSTKAYAQLRISYYSDEWVVYVHRSNGTWGTAHQAAFKDDLTLKQDTITGGASTIASSNLTANRALISSGSGKVAVSAVTNTELGYLDGVTSNIQTQLDGKAASSHNHAASNITSGTLSSDRLPTVPITKGGTGATTAAAALTNLGITATADEINKLDGITATTTELNYVDGVTSNIQTQLNGKAASSHTHNVLSVQSDNYKQGTDLPSTYPRGETIFFSNNPTNKFNSISYCTIHTIKGYNNMVCIQWLYPYNTNADTVYYRTALYNTDVWRDWKTVSVSGHTHNYAGSSSAGGSATSAVKLDTTTAGSATQPVYFADGKPAACTYTLAKSVPSNAVFTDTNTKVTNTLATTTKAYVTGTTSATTNTGTQVFDTGVYLDTTAGQLTATTFNGTTFKGSGVATVAEVKTYLGI